MSTLLNFNNWKKLLYNVRKISSAEEFFSCLDAQLSMYFEKVTAIEINPKVWLKFDYEDGLQYSKGAISEIKATIFLPHGSCHVSCCWKSKSGRIYDIADTDIDCNDVEFWMEGLDADYCREHMKPRLTLFGFHEQWQQYTADKTKLEVSAAFIACADAQLTPLFEKIVGYKANSHTSLMLATTGLDLQLLLHEKGPTSKLAVTFYNNHNWNNAYMLWRSRSGRVYEVGDAAIDCADIEFWLEGIDAALYQRQMYPKDPLPFKLKNLGYELLVERVNIDCTVTGTLCPEAIDRATEICGQLGDFIDTFNRASEAKGRKEGVVHNYYAALQSPNCIELKMDLGSAGASFIKKLLQWMSGLSVFEKVNIH
jgi:hypothetical protein